MHNTHDIATAKLTNNALDLIYEHSPSLSYACYLTQDRIIISRSENINGYKLTDSDYKVYIPPKYKARFLEEFHYFIEGDDVLRYDNLIHYTMIVKNAGSQLRDVITKLLPFIDRWTILDTGSTDETIDIINEVLVCKKGTLYQEPFVDFKHSRNRCLDLAGTECKYTIMLDDTYTMDGDIRKFLNTIRGDQFADSFSMFISSRDVSYCSNRVLKADKKLRYIYRIHEVVSSKNNMNVIVPLVHASINDYRCDYMETRTMDRKEKDIEMLFKEIEDDPDDPRALYYLGQTYNVLGKHELAYKYYVERVDHPVEGFKQERIDACFEAARTANFQLNKPWEDCEKLYMKSYEMDPTRPDALYFIGIHYYLEQDFAKAFSYIKKCFEIGYPEHCQYSLKPTLHYYFIPKFLSELSFICDDHVTGLKSANLFLENVHRESPFTECYDENDVKTLKSWKDIYALLVQKPKAEKHNPSPVKPFFVFMEDGGFSSWTGKDILNKGVGGAETFTIEMARYIQRQGVFNVVVFCRCETQEFFEGVLFTKLDDYFTFILENPVHTCVIGRYSEYYSYTIDSLVENIYLIAHDLDFTGNVIPIHQKLKKIFCLSEWHAEYFESMYPSLRDLIEPFGYGIDLNLFRPLQAPTPLKFIYSSFPIRGLLQLLQMWPKIVERYPSAMLYIHSNMNDTWSNNMRPDEMNSVRDAFKTCSNIVYNGWTSKKELANTWLSSDVCFYPCTYLETFCHTIMEAAASKTLIVTTKLGALRDTVGDRGVLIDSEVHTEEGQKYALNALFNILEDKDEKTRLINKNYEWALSNTWENRAKLFIDDYIENIPTAPIINPLYDYVGMYNWTNDIPANSRDIFIRILDYVKWKNSGDVNVLEIGTYAGTSLIEIVKHFKNCKAIAVDTWVNYNETYDSTNQVEILAKIEENNIERIFRENIRKAGIEDSVTAVKQDSTECLMRMIESNHPKFDFIYVDGCHRLLDSYTDILLSFELCKKGGVIAMDDYMYNKHIILESPYEGIEYFLKKFETRIKVLSTGYRVFIEKLS